MLLQEGKVLVQTVGTVVWDNTSQPDADGKYSLSVALPPSAPEMGELQQLVQQAIATKPAWGGQIPAGGNNPLAISVDPAKLGQEFTGMLKISGKSQFQPGVVDANNQPVNPMALAQYTYPGAKVMVILHAYAFDNKSKGVAFGLDGVMVVDNTTPRIAGGGIDVANAFAQAMGGAVPAGQPTAAAPVAGPGAVTPVGQPAVPTYKHTAVDATEEQYRAANWTTEQLVQNGKGEMETPASPVAPVGQPAAPVNPVVQQPATAPTYKHTAVDATEEQYRAANWTTEQLVQNGKGVMETAAPVAASPAGAGTVQPAHDFLTQPGVVPNAQ